MAMTINLRRLKAFISVADARSVTEAARRLHLTPPAVTKSVRELEKELGARLFDRTPEGMQLTRCGQAFYTRSKLALAELEQGREEVSVLLRGKGARIVAGAMPDAEHPILPLAVARALQRRPDLSVGVRGGSFERLMTATRAGELDFFVGAIPQDDPPDGIVFESVYNDELIVVGRPDHPLHKRKNIKLGDLGDQRWLLPDLTTTLGQLVQASFKTAGMSWPRERIDVGPLGSMRTILRESDFIATVTRMRVREELDLRLLVMLPVSLPGTRHAVGIIRRSTEHLTPWARELLAEYRRVASEQVS